jgi:glycosyltransferase involved in cell wall biosynthesis
MPRIIFINQYVTHLYVDIINDFINKGFDVTLLTGSVVSTHPISDKVRVKKFNAYKRNSSFSRLLTWLAFGFRSFLYLLFRNSPVFVCTNPPFMPVLVFFYQVIKKQKIYLLFYDLYPEAPERLHYITKNNFIYRIWSYFNRKQLISATEVFTISNHLQKELEKYGHQRKVHVIHPWSDNQFIKPIIKFNNSFVSEHQLTDKFIVLYSGNLGLTHDIESIVESAGLVLNDKDIRFVIIGDGPKSTRISDMVRDRNYSNVLLLPWQSPEYVPFTFASADIGVVTLGEGSEGISVPSKTFSYLAAGCSLLVISESGSEAERLVGEYQCGIITRPGDKHNIAASIIRLKNNPEELRRYKENALIASRDFTPVNAMKFHEIIAGVRSLN